MKFSRRLVHSLRSPKGFTLIELTAVIGITGLLLVLISSIFVQLVQSNTRATISNEIREEGQYIMENLVRSIRGADVVTAAGGVTVGKVLSITVSANGTSDVYSFICTNQADPNTQSLTKNGQLLNSTRILMDVNCNGSIDINKSYFEMIAPVAGAPSSIRVHMVLETTGTQSHREFAGTQTLTELVGLRTYSR